MVWETPSVTGLKSQGWGPVLEPSSTYQRYWLAGVVDSGDDATHLHERTRFARSWTQSGRRA